MLSDHTVQNCTVAATGEMRMLNTQMASPTAAHFTGLQATATLKSWASERPALVDGCSTNSKGEVHA
jgi:hypothetical protein